MPPDDILLNKAAIIERCVRRIREEFAACPQLDDFTRVDALTLNVERACQAAIDMAMHRVAASHLGIPQSNADAFTLLEKAGQLPPPIAKSMRAMAGFRNVAVHQYEEIDPKVLRWVAENAAGEWTAFCRSLGVKLAV